MSGKCGFIETFGQTAHDVGASSHYYPVQKFFYYILYYESLCEVCLNNNTQNYH